MGLPQTARATPVGLTTCTNAFEVDVTKCCASCAFKELTRAVTQRRCGKHLIDVRSWEVCKCWTMSEQLKMAGRAQGRVKRKEYLMYLVAEREDESLAEQTGLKVRPKSIAEIRAEFEREHGSIYMDDFRPFDQEW